MPGALEVPGTFIFCAGEYQAILGVGLAGEDLIPNVKERIYAQYLTQLNLHIILSK